MTKRDVMEEAVDRMHMFTSKVLANNYLLTKIDSKGEPFGVIDIKDAEGVDSRRLCDYMEEYCWDSPNNAIIKMCIPENVTTWRDMQIFLEEFKRYMSLATCEEWDSENVEGFIANASEGRACIDKHVSVDIRQKDFMLYSTDVYEQFGDIEEFKKNMVENDIDGVVTIDDISDEAAYEEMSFLSEIYFDDYKALLEEVLPKDRYFLLEGSCGLWNGRHGAGVVCTNVHTLIDKVFYHTYDNITSITTDGIDVYSTTVHHDGTNSFVIKVLTEEGMLWFDENENTGELSPKEFNGLIVSDGRYSQSIGRYFIGYGN